MQLYEARRETAVRQCRRVGLRSRLQHARRRLLRTNANAVADSICDTLQLQRDELRCQINFADETSNDLRHLKGPPFGTHLGEMAIC